MIFWIACMLSQQLILSHVSQTNSSKCLRGKIVFLGNMSSSSYHKWAKKGVEWKNVLEWRPCLSKSGHKGISKNQIMKFLGEVLNKFLNFVCVTFS